MALLAENGLDTDATDIGDGKLPPELMDMVRKYLNVDANALPMSVKEAREHRAKLMEVRSVFHQDADSKWMENTYNFCEH